MPQVFRLLIVSPQADDLDDLLLFVHLVNQSVMDVDAAGIGAFQIAYQFLIGRGLLERVLS